MENAYGGAGGGNGYNYGVHYVDQNALAGQMLAQQQAQQQMSYEHMAVLQRYNETHTRITRLEYELHNKDSEVSHLRQLLADKIKKGGELLKSRKKARHKMKMPRFFRFLFYIVIIVFVAKIVWSTNVISIANYFFPPHSQQVQVIHDKCSVATKK